MSMKNFLRNLYSNYHGMEKVGNTISVDLDGQPDFSKDTHFNRWIALPMQRLFSGLNQESDSLPTESAKDDKRKEERTRTTGGGAVALASSS
jgi:hypothetical protein